MRARHLICLAVTLGASFGAAADRPTARLSYVRKGGATICPDESLMRQLVAARLGYDPFRDDAERTVAVTIAREGAFRAKLEMKDASGAVVGTRTLASSSSDCNELASSIALAVAIAVDPLGGAPSSSASVSTSASASASAPAPASASAPVPAPAPAPAPALVPTPALHPFGSIGAAFAVGVAPALTYSLTAGFGLRGDRFSVAVEGRVDAEASGHGPAGGDVRSSVLAGSIVPCLHHEIVLGCAIASYGSLRGAGSGVTETREDRSPWAAVGVRAGLEAELFGPVALRFHVDGLALLTRTTLRVQGQDAWTTPALALVAGGSAVLHFR